MGLLLMTYEFMETATVAFDNAVRLAPDDYRWWYLAGYLQAMLGELESARASFESSLELEPAHLPATVRLAEVLLDLGEGERAKTLFDEALERQPGIARAKAGLARLASENGDDERAAELYEQVLAEAPAANSVHYALSQAYRRLGRGEDAEYHLARRGDIQVPLEDELTAAVAGLGRSPAFFMTRASEAMKNQRYDIAADAYSRRARAGIRGASRPIAVWPSVSMLSGMRLEPVRRSNRHSSAAGRVTPSAMRLSGPTSTAVWVRLPWWPATTSAPCRLSSEGLGEVAQRADLRQLLGNALARLGQLEQAVEALRLRLARTSRRRADAGAGAEPRWLVWEEATKGSWTSLTPLSWLPKTRTWLGSTSRHSSIRMIREPRRFANGWAREAERMRSLSSSRLGTRSKRVTPSAASSCSSRALGTEPGLIEARLLLAAIFGHLNRFDEAATQFRAVIDRSPRNEQAWQGELIALLMAQRYSDARERLREALEIYPRSAPIAHTLARLLVSSPVPGDRRGELGLELVDRVRAFDETDGVAETRAMALAEVGRLDEAASAQERVVGRSPGPAARRRSSGELSQRAGLGGAPAGRAREPPPTERGGTVKRGVTRLGLALMLAALAGKATAAESSRFVEVARAVGLDFVHDNGARGQYLMPEIVGSGVALFDYDDDGDLERVCCSGRIDRSPGPEH